jgi:prepilin-type N-terminal cleavage/methylation domain-containing protein
MKNVFTKKSGFTLAEVLITLLIIGVIALLVLPPLIVNMQNAEYVSNLKKAYSNMNQVLQSMALDNGGDIKGLFGTTTTAGNAISSHYRVIKNCKTAIGQGCFAPYNRNYDGSSTDPDFDYDNNGGYYKFITADGMAFEVYSFNNNCTQNLGFSAAPDSPTYFSICGYVYIDVNGLKEPNNWGRDVFWYWITSKNSSMLYPAGGFYQSFSNAGTLAGGGSDYWNYNNLNLCSKTVSKFGGYCTGRIMDKSWQMDY